MSDSLGIENISVQVFQEQAHTKFQQNLWKFMKDYIYFCKVRQKKDLMK